EIKLIFLLRHPTSRAYSNYWHMLRTGRAAYSFEDTIRYEPSTLLDRSLYKSQLETYYKHIPRERIKVILFEEFIADLQGEMEGVCDFLGLDINEFPADALEVHANKALLPKNIRLQVLKNRLLKNSGHARYLDTLPLKPQQDNRQVSFWEKAVNKLHYKLNPLAVRGKPKMKAETKIFLDKFFQRELEGIDELVGKNVMSIWFSRSLY
ncbi:MAG: sulfotransferase, partial [Bacteroidota bacterium]